MSSEFVNSIDQLLIIYIKDTNSKKSPSKKAPALTDWLQ